MNETDKHLEKLILQRHLEMFEGLWCYLVDDNSLVENNPLTKKLSIDILNKMKELKAHLK